ncbi:MAG: glycosyltransferase family 2 protein [Clostridia bacterium]|nr:glycosyltransferase family 2 protein [Clostridia bacterium]
MEKIDILLATYNGEKYLREQLDSILNQTYGEFNLIISDDCSNDNTRKILEEYELLDSRIKVYYQEKNLGYVKNFEFLLNKVESELYMLSDQDDVWIPEKIEETYNYLVSEKAELVFTDLTVVDENLNVMYQSFNDLMKYSKKAIKYDDYRLQFLYNCVTGCTLMTKKKYLVDILPIPNESEYVIHDFWIPLITSFNGKIKYLNKPLIKYRQHGNNQVGAKTKGNGYTRFEDLRDHFIDVKKQIFEVYVNNSKVFPDNLKVLSEKALKYFEKIENKKYFNFKGWSIFHRLYKNDNLYFYMSNFLIFNLPILAKIIFYIRLKMKNRRKI